MGEGRGARGDKARGDKARGDLDNPKPETNIIKLK